ncbi:uncharacterized protein LOC116010994 [Ipomoea triloba]|uniref:uncharacterized protein LOC116010994 n=1 Tax=Ipomoea triloba TaxID=35885 RepID=UPI00125D6758|nr:uncharacterized protein LOC116010994 [Ipomoea triloba]
MTDMDSIEESFGKYANTLLEDLVDSLTIFYQKRKRTGLKVTMDVEYSGSKNLLLARVHLPGINPWHLTFYYGFSERSRRQQSWDFFRALKSNSDLPWMVVGDFNDLSCPYEKRGIHPHPTSLFDGFNSALDDCGLFDLGMRGRRYTWERGKGTDNWVEERLDRAVAGVYWCSLFPQASVQNYDVLTSDHTAIFVEIEGPKHASRSRAFLFENAWLKESGCKDTVLESWNSSAGECLTRKLDHCGVAPFSARVVDLLNARRVRLRISRDA